MYTVKTIGLEYKNTEKYGCQRQGIEDGRNGKYYFSLSKLKYI